MANDGIHFCKGTCKEESQMWLDILRLFPTATVMGPGRATGNGGRAKRSATFPGIRIMSPASRFANNKAALSAMTNKNAEGNEVEDAAEDGDVADGMAGKDLIFFFCEIDYLLNQGIIMVSIGTICIIIRKCQKHVKSNR